MFMVGIIAFAYLVAAYNGKIPVPAGRGKMT